MPNLEEFKRLMLSTARVTGIVCGVIIVSFVLGACFATVWLT